jgi:defect-in-organelle-trafficking protein DotC
MRLSPATKAVLAAALLLTLAPAARAQQQQQPMTTQQQQMQQLQQQYMGPMMQSTANSMQNAAGIAQGLRNGGGMGSAGGTHEFYRQGQSETLTQAQYDARLQQSSSPQAKADRLAAQHRYQRDLEKQLSVDSGEDVRDPPPPDMEDLLELERSSKNEKSSSADNLPDNDGNAKEGDPALDLRRDAQKEAALSFGARGGLAKRNFEIMERLKGFEATLDNVFNFRALLVKAPSGLLIEPPIVREADNSLVVTASGTEAAVAERIYDINKQAKIVTAPRDWRAYILQNWVSTVPKPPRLLWPKDAMERTRWKRWVSEGWRAGTRQADEMFQSNLARLTADFNGMVRYRTLLTQGMISQPYAMHEDRGVTGSKTVMRVGDRALRITGPSQFLTTGTDLWKPADR